MLFSKIQDAFTQLSSSSSKQNVVFLPYSTNIDHNEYHFLPLIDEEKENLKEKEKENENTTIQLENNVSKLYFVVVSLFGMYLVYKMFKKTKI